MDLINQINLITTDWKDILLNYSSSIEEISDTLTKENEKEKMNTLSIFPPKEKIFRCFNYFNISDLRVVIIGQDCYHGNGQANGLCFSVDNDIPNPPSLRNIIKEISADLGKERTASDFSDLAKQGVLFLNASLTVLEKNPASHMKHWVGLTNNIIKDISSMTDSVIFVLWGNFAKNKKKYIDTKRHTILESTHPSPLSANRGGFFGTKHFSKINTLLEKSGRSKIMWTG